MGDLTSQTDELSLTHERVSESSLELLQEWEVNPTFKESKILIPPTMSTTKTDKQSLKQNQPLYDRILYYGEGVEMKSYKPTPIFNNCSYVPVSLIAKVQQKQSLLFNILSLKKEKNETYSQTQIDSSVWELNDFIIKECLSSDKNMTIHRCVHKLTKKEYSYHILKKKKRNNFNFVNFVQEIKSNFIVQQFKSFFVENFLVIITDLIDQEDFLTFLKRNFISEAEVKFYIAQIILALKQLHKQNIIHRNVNLNNIKLFPNGYVKLGGFSKSKVILSRSFTKFKTTDYSSPEEILHTGHNKAADYWSLGILTYHMLVGKTPFHKDNDQNEFQKVVRILQGEIEFPSFVSPQAKSFISSLLCKDQFNRLGVHKGIDEILNHVWMKSIDWNSLENIQTKPKYFPKKLNIEKGLMNEIFKEFKKLIPEENISEDPTTPREGPKERRRKSMKRSSSMERNLLIVFDDQHEDKTDSEGDPDEIFEDGVFDEFINKRKLEILNEFIETERIYVKNLQLLINEYLQPMLTQKIVSPEVHQKIFSSIQTIYKVNITFLDILEKCLKQVEEAPKMILNFIKSFKLYAPFIQNQNLCFETLSSERQKNSKFNNFINTKYNQLKEKGIDYHLMNLLSLPIQRISRYEIFCQDLLNNTPLEEKEIIEKACKEMKEIENYCNDKNKEYENSLNIFQAQRKYGLEIDKSQHILFEKSKEILFYKDENNRQLISEFLILNGIILIELKSKKQIKFEYFKLSIKEFPDAKEIELQSGTSKLKIGFEKVLFYEKYFEIFKNISTI